MITVNIHEAKTRLCELVRAPCVGGLAIRSRTWSLPCTSPTLNQRPSGENVHAPPFPRSARSSGPSVVPGLGVDSPQPIIAEVGASAATFPSAKQLASWMGACPGNEESAGVHYSHRCPTGNRQMRRVLNQAANAAVKAKGTIFAIREAA